ncbi:hypothetical protein LTS12_024225, partial [Elasticomyces elasticus]
MFEAAELYTSKKMLAGIADTTYDGRYQWSPVVIRYHSSSSTRRFLDETLHPANVRFRNGFGARTPARIDFILDKMRLVHHETATTTGAIFHEIDHMKCGTVRGSLDELEACWNAFRVPKYGAIRADEVVITIA